jgi:hypothetical protein
MERRDWTWLLFSAICTSMPSNFRLTFVAICASMLSNFLLMFSCKSCSQETCLSRLSWIPEFYKLFSRFSMDVFLVASMGSVGPMEGLIETYTKVINVEKESFEIWLP